MPSGDVVKLGLASVLKGCSANDIGITPDHIPSWVQTALPLSLIRPQLASGKVTIGVDDVLRGLEPEMRHLLAPARHDLEIVLPANELFHALPVSGGDAAPEPAATPVPAPAPESATKLPAGVPWPFEAKSAEPATPAPAIFEPAASTPAEKAFFQPFAAAKEPSSGAVPLGGDSPFPAFLSPAASKFPEPEPKPAVEKSFPAYTAPKQESPFPPGILSEAVSPPPAPAPVAKPIEAAPVLSSHEPTFQPFAPPAPPPPRPEPPVSTSAAVSRPTVPVSVVRPAVAPRVTSDADKRRQMLLRVLLGSQEDVFDAEAVIRLTTAQPGVAAAVCFLDGKSVASSGNGSPEANNFLRQAQKMIDHVEPLVALTGIDDTETISLKNDQHLITFSLQGQVTLAVLHDPQQQEPTLREKVTLIARELTGLLQAA
jgi:hypothetical protein